MGEPEAKRGTDPVSLYEHHGILIPPLLECRAKSNPLSYSSFTVKRPNTDLIRSVTAAACATDNHRNRIVNF